MTFAMSLKFHPELLQRRDLSIPRDQQNILENRTVSSEHGAPEKDVPPVVLASLRQHYADRDSRKRNAHQADLTPEPRLPKTARTSRATNGCHTHSSTAGSPPSTPMVTRRAAARGASSIPASSSPGTAVSWSPSPSRNQMSSPTKPIPSRLPLPSFQSSAPEEPLEVEVPRAQNQPPPTASAQMRAPSSISSFRRSQADTPTLRKKAHNIETPPCAQPSQSAGSEKPRPRLTRNQYKSIQKIKDPPVDLSPDENVHSGTPSEYVCSIKQISPFRSSVPSSSNRVPDSLPPPPGQTVAHIRWPAPVIPAPSYENNMSRSSGASQEIIGMTQRSDAEAESLQSSPFQAQIPPVQTMSYVSPDVSSTSVASQPEDQQAQASLVEISQAEALQAESLQLGDAQAEVYQAVASPADLAQIEKDEIENERAGQYTIPQYTTRKTEVNQEETGEGMAKKVSPRTELAEVELQRTKTSQADLLSTEPTATTTGLEDLHRLEGPPANDPPQDDVRQQPPADVSSTEARLATTSQEPSTGLAVSAISATQQPEKLEISFDENSESPLDVFSKVYPAYTGSLPQFVKACLCLEYMERQNSLHYTLWDDFVGAFPAYLTHVKNAPKGTALVAADWYNSRDEDILHAKRIINRTNLLGVLGQYPGEVQKYQKSIADRKSSSEPRSTRSTPIATPSKNNVGSSIRKQSAEMELAHDAPIIANTQLDAGRRAKTLGASPSHSRSDATPRIASTQNKTIRSAEKPQETPKPRREASADIVTKTPMSKNRRVSDSPVTLPKTASAVPSGVSKDKAAQRHSTGALPEKTTKPKPQMAPPSSKQPPSSSARKATSGPSYFAILQKQGKKEKEREKFQGFGRSKTRDRSSFSKSDAS